MKARTDRLRAVCGSLFLAVLVICFAGAPLHAQAKPSLLNRQAPELVFQSLKGRTIDLQKLRGNVVLLNFWATWCAPCEAEMPAFSQWQRKYGPKGFQVIGVSMDDSEAPVQQFVARHKPDYPIAMGDPSLGALFGRVLGLPLTYLIDRDGIVRAQFQGTADLKAVEKQVQQLLAKAPTGAPGQ